MVVVGLTVLLGLSGCRGPRMRPNVILITFDTLRADFLECYGNRVTRTPTFARLAKQGLVFDRAFATGPFTATSLWSLLYSEQVHNHTYALSIRSEYGRRGSVAARFKQAGYLTIGVVGSSIPSAANGYGQGFEHYLDTYAEPSFGNETTLRRVMEVSRQRLASSRQPFFLYVHFFDPHDPWDGAPAAFRTYTPETDRFSELASQLSLFRRSSVESGRLDRAVQTYSGERDVDRLKQEGRYERYVIPMYRSEVSWSDDILRRLLDDAGRHGLLENTVVAVTADHGISFGNHYQLMGYVFSLFNETLRVPLVMMGPGIPQGRVNKPVSLLDLGPTLLDVAAIDTQHSEGTSFRGVMAGQGTPRAVYAEATAMLSDQLVYIAGDDRSRFTPGVENLHSALVQGRHKLIHMPSRRGDRFELFDLKADPEEAHNIYSGSDPAHQLLVSQLLAKERRDAATEPPMMDPETADQLRALGYVK